MALEDLRQKDVPHIDMEVLREICSKAGCRRRATNGLHRKVIWLGRFLHAQVPEVEGSGTIIASCREMCVWMRGEHVVSAPSGHKRRSLHSCQW